MFTIQTKSCETCAFYLETAFITIIIIIIIFIIIIITIPINIIIKLIIITIIIFFHILEKMSPEKAISFFLPSSFLHDPFCFGQKNGTYSSHTIYVWIIFLCTFGEYQPEVYLIFIQRRTSSSQHIRSRLSLRICSNFMKQQL